MRAGEIEHALAHDVVEPETGPRKLCAHRDRYGRAESRLAGVDGDLGQLETPTRRTVGVPHGPVPQAERAELERRPMVRRRGRRGIRASRAAAERGDVQPSRAVADETHDRLVDDDPVDDETLAEERQEAEAHTEPACREKRLRPAEGAIVADRHPVERDADPATEREPDVVGLQVAAERPASRAEDPALLARERGEPRNGTRDDQKSDHGAGGEPPAAHSPSS